MSCKKEKNDNSKEGGKAKLRDRENSESIKKEISEKNANNSKNINERGNSGRRRSKNNRGNLLYNNQAIYSSNHVTFYGEPLPNISENENAVSPESVGLIYSGGELNKKEKIIFMKEFLIPIG